MDSAKIFHIVTRETPTTTSFPTCRERHRYMKAVIVSIKAHNNIDCHRRNENDGALYKSAQ
jgi:hypothetical protein